MVAKAKEELELELEEKEEQKAKYLEEKSPPIQTSSMSLAELQVHDGVRCHISINLKEIKTKFNLILSHFLFLLIFLGAVSRTSRQDRCGG